MLSRVHDSTYGPHYEGEKIKMGNYDMIMMPDDNIKIGNEAFEGTEGLYQLIFEKEPHHYSETDLNNYRHILKLTGKHLKTDGQIKSNARYKYMRFIKNIFPPKKGAGLMSLNNKPIEYVYYDDLNELVDRLEILIREQNSGYTGHNNEIQSILEELQERRVIKTL